MMRSGHIQHPSHVSLTGCLAAAVAALVLPALAWADSSSAATDVFDPLASLREEPGDYNCDLRLDDFEPPGGEDILTRWIAEWETLLDDELETCQQALLLTPIHLRDQENDGHKSFTPLGRTALLAEAQQKGCKPRKKASTTPAKLDSVAKRYLKATNKMARFVGRGAKASELKRYVSKTYDADKFGPSEPEGLCRLHRRAELQESLLDQCAGYLLVPVKGTTPAIEHVEDWRLYAKQSKPFNKTIKTGSGSELLIENMVTELFLIGTDNSFNGVSADNASHNFEGYFLYARHVEGSDDVNTSVVLVKRPEIDPLVERLRGLVQDYARIRAFRTAKLAKRPLLYVDADVVANDLLPAAAEIIGSQQDQDARLEALQQHFGAPKTGRTRTKDWKAIEWTGPLTAVRETLDVEIKIDAGGGSTLHTVAFNAAGTPLAEQAAEGKLKLGQAITVVGKVAQLDYDGSTGGSSLLFALTPLVGERQAEAGEKKPTKTKPKQGKKEPRRRMGIFPG